MKRTTKILALIAVAALMAAPATEAGWFNKDKRTERDDSMPKTWRFNRMPAMTFHMGELQRDGFVGWTVGDLAMQLGPDCKVTNESGGDDLREGRSAIVMGSRSGDTIVAWRVRVLKPEFANSGMGRDHRVNVVWSESDRTVGEGTGPE